MSEPVRIQRKRIAGWRMPPNTVSVTRPGRWGNSFEIGKPFVRPRMSAGGGQLTGYVADAAHAARLYRRFTCREAAFQISAFRELNGKNLACFCGLCEAHSDGKPFGVRCHDCAPCHADPLGMIANPGPLDPPTSED